MDSLSDTRQHCQVTKREEWTIGSRLMGTSMCVMGDKQFVCDMNYDGIRCPVAVYDMKTGQKEGMLFSEEKNVLGLSIITVYGKNTFLFQFMRKKDHRCWRYGCIPV